MIILSEEANHEQSSQNNKSTGGASQKSIGEFFRKKSFSQQFRKSGTGLPNYFHGEIQTLNFKMT